MKVQKCYGCQKEILSDDSIPMCESCARVSKVREGMKVRLCYVYFSLLVALAFTNSIGAQ